MPKTADSSSLGAICTLIERGNLDRKSKLESAGRICHVRVPAFERCVCSRYACVCFGKRCYPWVRRSSQWKMDAVCLW